MSVSLNRTNHKRQFAQKSKTANWWQGHKEGCSVY